jgi:hypothetical protein
MKLKEIMKKYTPDIFKTIVIHIYVRYLYYFKYKKILSENRKLKNKYQGKRCFLIGNGPSLNQMDLIKLRNEYTFVFNFFYLHKDFNKIKPKFYCLMEPLKNLTKYNVNINKFFPEINKAFKNIDVKMFFRVDIKRYIESNKLFLNKNIHYLLADRGILKTLIINDDISKYYSFADASINNAICIAVYLGFSEIYLVGCDYDIILCKDIKHFYENELSGGRSPLKNANNLILAKDLVEYLEAMEKIKNHFKKYNVKIFNAGIGGLTDTFPRVDYDSLFRQE